MYNLHLSPEQLAIRDTVREFVVRDVKPVALAAERLEAPERPLSVDLLDGASQLGLRVLALSESSGGAGADTLTCCIVAEELAAGDPDLAAVLMQTWTLAPVVFDRLMTQPQRERFLPAFLADPRCHLACAGEEPQRNRGLGIHYHRPRRRDAALQTTAVRCGDSFVINGSKHRVASASLAKLFAVEVATGAGKGASTILLPRDTPGLSVELDCSAMQHGACGVLTLRDCRVPTGNLLGREGGSELAGEPDRRSAQNLALNLGIGRAAYEAALDYAQLRVQGGRRIIEHQAIGAKLADSAVRLEVARAAIWQAAWACDHPAAFADRSLPDLPLARIAKVFSSQAIYQATKDAAECFGAMGVMRDMPLQKYVHDALVCLNSGEPAGDARLRIAEAIAGYRKSTGSSACADDDGAECQSGSARSEHA
jgi:alkylation response protein AidB-like acyl-CoA dehydrogenase